MLVLACIWNFHTFTLLALGLAHSRLLRTSANCAAAVTTPKTNPHVSVHRGQERDEAIVDHTHQRGRVPEPVHRAEDPVEHRAYGVALGSACRAWAGRRCDSRPGKHGSVRRWRICLRLQLRLYL